MSNNGHRPEGNESEAGDLLVALCHELRRQILQSMPDDKAISPSEISEKLELPLSNVSYHVRVLAKRGAITLERTEPVGGSMQHFYRRSLKAKWALDVLGLQSTAGGQQPPEDKD